MVAADVAAARGAQLLVEEADVSADVGEDVAGEDPVGDGGGDGADEEGDRGLSEPYSMYTSATNPRHFLGRSSINSRPTTRLSTRYGMKLPSV